MKDSELQIDRSCHVLYSKSCKKEILAKITLHYPEAEWETVWEKVQRQYAVVWSVLLLTGTENTARKPLLFLHKTERKLP